MIQDLYTCNHCFKEYQEKEIDNDTGMCLKCIQKLRLKWDGVNDTTPIKKRIKLID